MYILVVDIQDCRVSKIMYIYTYICIYWYINLCTYLKDGGMYVVKSCTYIEKVVYIFRRWIHSCCGVMYI